MDKERKKGIQIHRSIVYGSHARLLTDEEKASGLHDPSHTHKWTVFLTSAPTPPPKTTGGQSQGQGKGKGKGESITNVNGEDGEVVPEDIDFITGGADDLSWLIKRVAFKLHETYANFNRNIDKPPFRVTETGWGEFSIAIRVQFQPETSEKTLTLSHNLKLHHWGPVAVAAAGAGAGAVGGTGTGTGSANVAGEDGNGTVGPAGNPGGESYTEVGDGDISMAGIETAPVTQANTPVPNNQPSTTDSANPKPPASDSTPTPAADADESALTAPPDEDDEDVKMEGGEDSAGTKGAEKDADGTEDDEDADAEGEDDDDDDADGEADDAAADGHRQPSLTSRPQGDGMNVDLPSSRDPGSAPSSSTFYVNPLPVHSWQYDEIVFSDPTPQFYDLLLAHEPSKLPLRSRRKPDDEGAGGLVNQDRGSAGVPLEFTLELERAEANKLDEARRKVVEETDVWRQRIIELEKEQLILKEQVAGY